MATEKSFQLYINEDNVKQYFSASGGALNGAAIGGKYITMRTSSTTATFTMNDAGRDVLFPSAAAIAHKVDVWAQAIATLSSSKNTINVAIAGQNAVATEKISTSLAEHTGSVSGSFTKSSTSAIYTIKIANGFHAAGVRDTSITAYFTQYACTANASGNGVKSVSVSDASPYEGETITFSAKLYNGANFEGWYSDAACTQQVSTDLTYSTFAADLTLYAKATIDAEIYTCGAVAGENITSASVSELTVVSGESVTFSADLNEGCLFDGWFSDANYSNLISVSNPYTTPITSNTTLYAKASKKQFTMIVGAAEHGTTSVSATTVLYGDNATFTFTPEDETWELYGWYSDIGLTQLVTEENPYSFVATSNMALYPKVGKKRYTITFGKERSDISGKIFELDIIIVYYNLLTRDEIGYLRTGEHDKISSSKIFARDNIQASNFGSAQWKTIKCPYDAYVAVYAPQVTILGTTYYSLITNGKSELTSWPYYWFQPNADTTISFSASDSKYWCNCTAVPKDGVAYAYVTTPTHQSREAMFEAEVLSGYDFAGWYSDESCTTLVSADNPAKVNTPEYAGDTATQTSLTLYAKATKVAAGTGLYIKVNGVYVEATIVYKKVDGVWTQQTEPKNLFSGSAGGSESNYIYCGKIEP